MKTKMLTIAAVLVVAAMTSMVAAPMATYASSDGDESETNTEQEIKQKNVGSGESTNFNCAQNLINSETEQECEAEEEIDGGGLKGLLDGLLR